MKRYFIEAIDEGEFVQYFYIYVYDDFSKELVYFSSHHKHKYPSSLNIGYLQSSKNFEEVSENYMEKLLVELELSK